jgi:hopanoid biosynthesis associated RND transporter like protein HpnN
MHTATLALGLGYWHIAPSFGGISLRRSIVQVVEWCWRHPVVVVLAALAMTLTLAVYAAQTLKLDTDEKKLISDALPFRQAEQAMDRAFPHNADTIAVVIDGPTPEAAEIAVDRLQAALAPRTDLLVSVHRPWEELYFRHRGLLFLSVDELADMSDRLVQAQPFLGVMARDPSLRGLLSIVDLTLAGVEHGQGKLDDLAPVIDRIEAAAAEAAAGRTPKPVSWMALMGDGRDQPRRFLIVQPKMQFDELTPGAEASDAIRTAARQLGMDAAHGFRVRLTGSVALTDANFATVVDGVEVSAPLSLAAVLVLLFFAVRSGRVVGAILISLLVGLVATAGFAAATVGSLNPISVAFAVMFVGIAVDFAIQFVVCFRNALFRSGDRDQAIRTAASDMAAPLSLAAVATAVGFLSFLPTAYSGVSQLGLIAGAGMVIALVVDFTVLPALMALMRPPAEGAPVGLPLGAADDWLTRNARTVVRVAVGAALLGVVLLPGLRFDFNPLNLQDPKAEAVSTFLELAKDPDGGTHSLEVLAPSVEAAATLAGRLDALPEVGRAMSIATFVPGQQDEKLAIVQDLATLLGPSLNPVDRPSPPKPDDLIAAMTNTAERLHAVAPADERAKRLAASLRDAAKRGPDAAGAVDGALASGIAPLLSQLRRSLDPSPVTQANLPPEIVRDWVAADGRARVSASPKGDMQDDAQAQRFVDAVHAVAPEVIGMPVSIREIGRVVIDAFTRAGIAALVAIGLLLALMLRRLLDGLLVVAPLLMGAFYTVIAMRVAGLSINFANIIALPLLLGIGVAFNIYYVVNWRKGVTGHLQSPTTRAVLFSALTTGSAFGSLAVSPHVGTASMGMLLFLSLGLSVATTLVVMPALFAVLGRPKP